MEDNQADDKQSTKHNPINKTNTQSETMVQVSKSKAVEDTSPVMKGSGSCYSFQTTNTKKWYDVFATYYFDNVEEDDQNELTSWDESNKKSVIIKYEQKNTNLSLTITIHRTTGTIMVQGAAKSLEIWINQHYPGMLNILKPPTTVADNKKTTMTTEEERTNEEQQPPTHIAATTTGASTPATSTPMVLTTTTSAAVTLKPAVLSTTSMTLSKSTESTSTTSTTLPSPPLALMSTTSMTLSRYTETTSLSSPSAILTSTPSVVISTPATQPSEVKITEQTTSLKPTTDPKATDITDEDAELKMILEKCVSDAIANGVNSFMASFHIGNPFRVFGK